jgi:hypothetical protein
MEEAVGRTEIDRETEVAAAATSDKKIPVVLDLSEFEADANM